MLYAVTGSNEIGSTEKVWDWESNCRHNKGNQPTKSNFNLNHLCVITFYNWKISVSTLNLLQTREQQWRKNLRPFNDFGSSNIESCPFNRNKRCRKYTFTHIFHGIFSLFIRFFSSFIYWSNFGVGPNIVQHISQLTQS